MLLPTRLFCISKHKYIYQPETKMERNYAVHSATNTIDVVLEKGAEKLYDKYLNQKLPQHTHHQNESLMNNNLSLHQVATPTRQLIESVPLTIVQAPACDPSAPKRVSVKKQNSRFSTLSPKNTTMGKSTKYQTIISGPQSNITKRQGEQTQNNSMLLEQNFGDTTMSFRKERPMTMQTGRGKRDGNMLGVESKIQEVEEKRAATCHTRKRPKFVSAKEKMSKMVKLKEEGPLFFKEEIETFNRFKRYKMDKMEEQNEKEQERARVEQIYSRREKKTRDNFEEAKDTLRGKGKEVPITNFESSNGEVTLNGRVRQQQRTHIIQLQFNPEEERTLKSQEAKVSGVNSVKKTSFVAKLKKKLKITNEEYTNNGERQISSIPFIALNCGIALSESILQATASRRRPTDEVSRDQYTSESSAHRFKSHIPIVNSARINMFATVDDPKQTARSSLTDNFNTISVERKDFETTLESRKEMRGSILWRPRGQSQGRDIRISNKEAYKEELLEMKLVQ